MFRSVLPAVSLAAALLSSVPATGAQQAAAWDETDIRQLLQIIRSSGAEGLDPASYGAGSVEQAFRTRSPSLDSLATQSAFRLARDYANGRTPAPGRVEWHIGSAMPDAALLSIIQAALVRDDVAGTLNALLPSHPEYGALRDALAATSDAARQRVIRVNLDRWRWMPRDLGSRHVLVNVPAYELQLIEEGRSIDRRAVVVGKPSLATPQFGATATAIIFNPWWEVPPSIVRESVGSLMRRHPARARAQGYMTVRSAGGTRVRQAPGPHNALGQMKLVMPNPFNVYLHDTPSKSHFKRPIRALSHGCIRVERATEFAGLLLSDGGAMRPDEVKSLLATRRTQQVPLARSVPVWIGYFTAGTAADGSVVTYPDIYGRDGPVWAAIGAKAAPAVADSHAPDECTPA